jgi:small subunit ribosomal protein S2
MPPQPNSSKTMKHPQRRERKSRAAKKERVKKEDSEAMKAAVVSKFAKDEDVDE